jgi:hypothetical protein
MGNSHIVSQVIPVPNYPPFVLNKYSDNVYRLSCGRDVWTIYLFRVDIEHCKGFLKVDGYVSEESNMKKTSIIQLTGYRQRLS